MIDLRPFARMLVTLCAASVILAGCTSRGASDVAAEGSAGGVAPAVQGEDDGSGAADEAAASEPEGEGSAQPAAPTEERIVSLIPAATEMVHAIGAGDQLVGRSAHCDYPPEVEALPSVGSGLAPDIERIVSLRPTLVIGSQLQEGSAEVNAIADAGITVLLVPDQSLEEVAGAFALIGRQLGRVDEAREVVEGIERRLLATQERVADREAPFVLVAIGRDPLFAAGADSFIGEIVTIAGGENVLPGDWVQLDDEILARLEPEVIIEGDNQPDDGFWYRYRTLPAVETDRFCRIDGDTMARPGPRLVDAAEAVARCLHPGT